MELAYGKLKKRGGGAGHINAVSGHFAVKRKELSAQASLVGLAATVHNREAFPLLLEADRLTN